MQEMFRNPRRIATAATIALILFGIADLLVAAGDLNMIHAINSYQLEPFDIAILQDADSVRAIVALLYLLALCVTGVIVLRWVYRVNKNAHVFNDDHMKISPAWNVGWFFVPFAGLYLPFEGLAQTFQVSADPQAPADVPIPGLMRLWWGAWLVMGIGGNIVGMLALKADTLDMLRFGAWANLVLTVADFTTIATLLWLIRTLTGHQMHNFPPRMVAIAGPWGAAAL